MGLDNSSTPGGRESYGTARKGFKHRIDSIADAKLLETERRSLQRLLVAARDPKQFRKVAAQTADILDRLKLLAEEESEAEVDG